MTIDEAVETVQAYAGGNTPEQEYLREALRVLLAEREAKYAALMDRKHVTSCNHKWTMRHTACPECFAELRQRAEAAEALRRLDEEE